MHQLLISVLSNGLKSAAKRYRGNGPKELIQNETNRRPEINPHQGYMTSPKKLPPLSVVPKEFVTEVR
jgi:hypothetical protein